MNRNREKRKQPPALLSSAREWVLLYLVVFAACAAAALFQHTRVMASEPDLSLIKAVYARSHIAAYPQGGASPVVIPAAAFRPDSDNRQWGFGFNNAYLYPTGAAGYCGIAPVYLPDGAKVTRFTGYLYDNDGEDYVNVYLYAKPLGSASSSTYMALLTTSTNSTEIQTLSSTSITQPVIDNGRYVYHIGVCMWGTSDILRFYAAKIDFQMRSYLPAILH